VNHSYLSPLKVLIVEDNEVNQLVALKYLEKWGMKADLANNGLEAVKMAENKQYELILMDLQMPEMDGYEAAIKIRALRSGYKETPIIALTAATFGEIRDKIKSAGINEYITKPFSPDELLAKIQKYLKQPETLQEPEVEENNYIKPAVQQNTQINIPPGKIEQRLRSLTHNDAAFVKELSRLYVGSLDELHTVYSKCLFDRDLARLREIRHKHKANIEMLELNDLANKLDYGKDMLMQGEVSDTEIAEISSFVHQYCTLVITELHKILNEN
jgi:CheY-like chemotaxis protein